jgi:hypothetical protein
MSQTTTLTLLPQCTSLITGDKQPAACYYIAGKTLQTLNWKLTALLGTVVIQGTLVDDPQVNTDWFPVYNIICTPSNNNGGTTQNPAFGYANINGNFAWLRAVVSSYTSGSVEYLKVTY